MNKKIWLVGLIVVLLSLLSACRLDTEADIIDDEVITVTQSIKDTIGLEDETVIKNTYFNPLRGVRITNQDDEDITHYLHVAGFVHYGAIGTYTLHYTMTYGEDSLDITRTIEIIEGTIETEDHHRPSLNETTVEVGEGSYKTGADDSIQHPVNPTYIDPYLLSRAVPSNGWWTALLVQNYGGSNGIYTNPYRSSFSNSGVEITNPGKGFVQYWNPEGYDTMANFSLALPDFHVKSSDLGLHYQTQVIDYSDTTVQVALRNQQSLIDHMVVTYTQGSPFIFFELANENAGEITLATNGVSNYEFFTVSGMLINGNSYIGDGLIIKLVQKHVGYQTFRPAQVGQPTYDDRYFLITTPDDTQFNLSSDNHPFGLTNKISIELSEGNAFSVSALESVSEARYYHTHGFNKALIGDVTYDVDYEKSEVITTYQTAYQSINNDLETPYLQFLMPHHYQHIVDSELTEYAMHTIRGELKLLESHTFKTRLFWHGVIPAMPHPGTDAFSEAEMVGYLEDLATRTIITDDTNFLNNAGPYWNSKAIYPLSQGIIIADQIGNEALKQDLIEKLRYVLTDWFSVSSSEDDRYLFYNQAWGSVYYSNNDFSTATELSDHSFTHGYLVYAAGVLAMYDSSFVTDYGDSVDLLLRDYMHPIKNDDDFAYLRSFDPWAGHTWAHGFGTFAEGNNLESSSEALNSWVGGYLWALATENKALKDAAIYGFLHELNHAKTMMFDYSNSIFPDAYSQYAQVAGIVWGGKYDYATWFGANPTFIYGIQWLPNGEYLSSYALNPEEKARLSHIYSTYLNAKDGEIDTWFATMWSIQALLDSNVALEQFNASSILNDDYPSDLSQTYYLIHGLNAYGTRTTEYVMQIHPEVASTIYISEQGNIHALVWNPSDADQVIKFNIPGDEVIEISVDARSFTAVLLNDID